ncbi:MAG: hypothetical protein JRJ38_13495 [Deltaproteobacteria bacterium]|nr:hypothetical protein [Deltaproteobacteria bacterium]
MGIQGLRQIQGLRPQLNNTANAFNGVKIEGLRQIEELKSADYADYTDNKQIEGLRD